MNNYIKVETKGKFSLYINQPVWCTKYCDKGHFINKNTGEDIGKYKELYIHYYDDKFSLLDEPIKEEDIYGYINE